MAAVAQSDGSDTYDWLNRNAFPRAQHKLYMDSCQKQPSMRCTAGTAVFLTLRKLKACLPFFFLQLNIILIISTIYRCYWHCPRGLSDVHRSADEDIQSIRNVKGTTKTVSCLYSVVQRVSCKKHVRSMVQTDSWKKCMYIATVHTVWNNWRSYCSRPAVFVKCEINSTTYVNRN
jgi:hypothetical protein